jgi:hypothetical protein
MVTALFLLFVVSVTGASVWLWHKRVAEITHATALREHERAVAMGLLPHLARAAVMQDRQPDESSAHSADVAPGVKQAAPAYAPFSRPVFRPDAPPDAALLKRIRRRHFARVGLAYFEASGLKARQEDGNHHIDLLLYAHGSVQPVMAVRWSRHLKHRASEQEIAAFAKACAEQKVAHGTFISQHGVDPGAEAWAGNSGITLLDCARLAEKLASLPHEHFADLHAVARGLK